MVSYVPKLSKAVVLLSSMQHIGHIDLTSNGQRKPQVNMYCISTNGGVDTNDHMCDTYRVGSIVHRTNIEKLRTHVRLHFLRQFSAELVQNHQKRRLEVSATPEIVKKRLMEVHDLENFVPPTTAKRGRCKKHTRKSDKNVSTKCKKSTKFVCNDHSVIYCQLCNKSDSESF